MPRAARTRTLFPCAGCGSRCSPEPTQETARRRATMPEDHGRRRPSRPDQLAEVDSSLGYMLLKPDCLFRGLVGPALRRVEDAGFQIVGYEVLGSLDRETVHSLFGRSFNGPHDVWDINARLFDLGPSVLAIVRHTDDGTDAARLLNQLKGAIMPALSPGSIRSTLGVQNRVLNLVHTPN